MGRQRDLASRGVRRTSFPAVPEQRSSSCSRSARTTTSW